MTATLENTEQVTLDADLEAAIEAVIAIRREEEELKLRKEEANQYLAKLIDHRVTYQGHLGNFTVSIRRDEPKPKFSLSALANHDPDLYARCMVDQKVFDMDLLRKEYAAGHISTELTELIVEGYSSPKPFPILTVLKEKK